jgi:pSer/pThr/pTyr-binding forkhead associated (FHA) protein
LWTAGDGVWLEDRSTYGTWVNDQRIGGRVPLREGDRLRIGSPGTELLLLREVDERGAP